MISTELDLIQEGYRQVETVHFDIDSTAAPGTNDTTIAVVYMLACCIDRVEDLCCRRPRHIFKLEI
jgi:hypothetical protein